MHRKLAVIAIGGNSLISDPKNQTVEAQHRNVAETCIHVAEIIDRGWDVVVTHGNGPQVGFILLRSDLAKHVIHEVPLETCVADTQGAIGYQIQQSLGCILGSRGIRREVATIVTQVVVDPDDPSFATPSKPIGPFYSEQEARVHERERGWQMTEDAGRGWRRVVASPRPQRVVEIETIRALTNAGVAVIAVGGGGIPVIEKSGCLTGIAAVIDKDSASAMLASELGASLFVISTTVEKVCLNYKKPNQVALDTMTAAQAREYLAQGHFAKGSMLPKIESGLYFLERGGQQVIISCPDKIEEAMKGRTGTRMVP